MSERSGRRWRPCSRRGHRTRSCRRRRRNGGPRRPRRPSLRRRRARPARMRYTRRERGPGQSAVPRGAFDVDRAGLDMPSGPVRTRRRVLHRARHASTLPHRASTPAGAVTHPSAGPAPTASREAQSNALGVAARASTGGAQQHRHWGAAARRPAHAGGYPRNAFCFWLLHPRFTFAPVPAASLKWSAPQAPSRHRRRRSAPAARVPSFGRLALPVVRIGFAFQVRTVWLQFDDFDTEADFDVVSVRPSRRRAASAATARGAPSRLTQLCRSSEQPAAQTGVRRRRRGVAAAVERLGPGCTTARAARRLGCAAAWAQPLAAWAQPLAALAQPLALLFAPFLP